MKYALIGFGAISRVHVAAITEKCQGTIIAVADNNSASEQAAQALGARFYPDYRRLLQHETPDIVVILTPHYFHPEISIAALQAGCHVFCEKPVAVHKAHAQELRQALIKSDRVFGVNYMNRFRSDVQHLKTILEDKRLGQIQAVHFVNNNWLRSAAYYRSGNWRGTWSKEGGGVLTNQAPHDLDRIIYLFGLPSEIVALAGTSSFHGELAVEDHVDALLSYDNGMRLFFSTATHVHPGVDRMEIWGDRGYLKMENYAFTAAYLNEPLQQWNEKNTEMFGAPQPEKNEYKIEAISFNDLHGLGHSNFSRAVAGQEPVMTPFDQAIQSVELANAMVLAGFTGKLVQLPLNSQDYCLFLQEMIEKEKKSKKSLVTNDIRV